MTFNTQAGKPFAVPILATLAISLGMSLMLGACSDSSSSKDGITQTGFPGQFTAGGATSGEVMSRATRVASGGQPSGTPGIPQGSEGNTGGAAMGGTTGGTSPPGGAQGNGKEQSSGEMPSANTSGTPGIPGSSGGNTGGTTASEGVKNSPKQAGPPSDNKAAPAGK